MHDSGGSDQRLLTISTFARAVGIPPSALRHYSAEGVLVPADVDPRSGYRYYAPDQIAQGVLVQRMRAAAVPLGTMRAILTAAGPGRTALLDELLASHSTRTSELGTELRSLRDELVGAPSARAVLSGPALAHALHQVIPAAATADEELATVVWEMGTAGLTLMATDRYWLAHRVLPTATESAPARLLSSLDAARSLAARCERAGLVEVEIAEDGVTVRRTSGPVLFAVPSAAGSVPDLDRLVASQPPARVTAGFPRQELLEITATSRAWRGGAPGGGSDAVGEAARLRFGIDGQVAQLRRLEEPARLLSGWAAVEGGVTPAEVLIQAALLEAAVERCPGGEVLLALVDGATPLRVLSPSQDTFTALVMPMSA